MRTRFQIRRGDATPGVHRRDAGLRRRPAAVLDLAEVARQLGEDNTGPAALTAPLAALDTTAAGIAFRQATTADSDRAPAR
jgi:hypothetical protein